MTVPADLAARAAELLPGLDTGKRLDLLGAMTPDEANSCLAWILTMFPGVFDASVVRDRRLAERLTARIVKDGTEDEDDGGGDGS